MKAGAINKAVANCDIKRCTVWRTHRLPSVGYLTVSGTASATLRDNAIKTGSHCAH
jgi:hypothetical protein